ncbi:sulfite exporter TauE/SafE family protein, partial [Alphaproteobacteria bacterium]|nr:sulfite exporter TauE/SafE family protein [Alphaproteobacteria bacterium]
MIEFINSFILPSQEIAITIAVLAIFLFAGIVKGFLGIGLPAAAMAFLTLVMDPTIAISLLTLPIIFTNVMQYARCENPRPIARKYWVFALAIIVSIFITSFFILSYPKTMLTISIGLAMIAFSLTQMTGARLPIGSGYGWHVGVGLFSGVLGGLSSIWSPPVAMYLLARDVDKSEFIGATGFLFLAGSLPLAAGLALAGVLTIDTVLHSLMGLIVVLVGFRIGE